MEISKKERVEGLLFWVAMVIAIGAFSFGISMKNVDYMGQLEVCKSQIELLETKLERADLSCDIRVMNATYEAEWHQIVKEASNVSLEGNHRFIWVNGSVSEYFKFRMEENDRYIKFVGNKNNISHKCDEVVKREKFEGLANYNYDFYVIACTLWEMSQDDPNLFDKFNNYSKKYNYQIKYVEDTEN